MSVEIAAHDIEDVDDQRVAYGIENLIAVPAIEQDVFRAEHGEVLGGVGLLDIETVDEGAGGQFAVTQLLDDGDARGMGEGLKEVGLELAEYVLHYIGIFAISNIPQFELAGTLACFRIEDG